MKELANKIANKISLANLNAGKYENKRNCPFFSEWKGMEQALKALGINFEYEYNDNSEMIAVIVEGERAEIKTVAA